MRRKKLKLVGVVGLIVSLSLVLASAVAADPSEPEAAEAVYTWACSSSDACGRFQNSGSGYGVEGYTTGSSARGVYGNSSGSSGQGVRGYSSGASGYGVYGRSPYYIGVRGEAGTGSGDYGGYFTGYEGVHGIDSGSDGYGTSGEASGTYGRGVYGYASGTSGYGGFFRSSSYRGMFANGASGQFDGYFPDVGLVVEYHGHQHYIFPNAWHYKPEHKEAWHAMLERDRIKKEMVEASSDLTYLEVRFDDPLTSVDFYRGLLRRR